MRIPVTVVTGFLGAGKSTLVDRWLGELPRHETAVIVNEAGEIGIDGALLGARAGRLREITGGCVCCATQVELAAALAELADAQPAPTRILVETSGAASPAGVVRPLTRGRAADRLRLDGIITVVDATRVERALAHALAIEQLGFADVVLLTHLDRFDGDPASIEARLVAHAPSAVLAHAPHSLLPLLDARADVLRILSDGAASPHPIDAVSLTLDGALDEDRFGDWVEAELGAIEARLLRVKGILALDGVDARVIVQGVGEAIEVTLGAPWGDAPRTSRLVILGLGLDAAALELGFRACGV